MGGGSLLCREVDLLTECGGNSRAMQMTSTVNTFPYLIICIFGGCLIHFILGFTHMSFGALRSRPCPLCGLEISKGQLVEPHLMEKQVGGGRNRTTISVGREGTTTTTTRMEKVEPPPPVPKVRKVLQWSHPECVARIADTQPPKSSRPACKHWLRVDCAYGDKCFFRHPPELKASAAAKYVRVGL